MHKLLVKLLIIGLIVQTTIIFGGGINFGISFGSININFLECLFFIFFYIFIVSFKEYYKKVPFQHFRFSRSMVILFILFVPFLIFGTYKGIVSQYPAALSYGLGLIMTIFFIVATNMAGFSYFEIWRWLRIIVRYFTVIAVISIPLLIANRFWGVSTPISLGYYAYSVWFMFLFGFIFTFIKIFIGNNATTFDKIGFIIFSAVQIIGIEKKIIVPLMISIATAILINNSFRIRSKQSLATKITKLLIIMALAIFVVVVVSGVFEGGSLSNYYHETWQERFLHSEDNVIDLLGGRGEVWRESFKMIAERPLNGYGLGILVANPFEYALKPFLSAHNTYLHFILAFGIPGGSILILLIIVLFRKLYQSLSRNKFVHYDLCLIMFSYIVGYLFMCLFDVFAIAQSGYVLFGLLSGFLLSLGGSKPQMSYITNGVSSPAYKLNESMDRRTKPVGLDRNYPN